ncbi:MULTISPECIES: glycosyltransferase family 2 protein [Pirellulaceae]|nr:MULTISPECIES: glycosyltransferase [Pirellulaceae]
MSDVPMISVVIPLPDDRGYAVECLTGFTQQALDVSYEVVVATDAASYSEIAWLVDEFPQVRWVYRPGMRMNAHYNAGAEVARGKYLYITESHCVPRRDCLQQIYDFVQRSELPVVCSASDGLNGNYLAECEQYLFEEDFQCWVQDKKCKIAIRGTLIERALWEQVGGFQAEFGHFSELLIGHTLEAAGVPIGYAENSRVSHGNQVSLKPLHQELVEYGEDECRACQLLPVENRVIDPKEWGMRKELQENPGKLKYRQFKAAVRQCVRELALNYLPLSPESRLRIFRNYWQDAISQGRLQYIAGMKTENAEIKATATPPAAYQKAA